MKKIAIRVAVAGMVLIIAGVILLVLFLDGMIKKGVRDSRSLVDPDHTPFGRG